MAAARASASAAVIDWADNRGILDTDDRGVRSGVPVRLPRNGVSGREGGFAASPPPLPPPPAILRSVSSVAYPFSINVFMNIVTAMRNPVTFFTPLCHSEDAVLRRTPPLTPSGPAVVIIDPDAAGVDGVW